MKRAVGLEKELPVQQASAAHFSTRILNRSSHTGSKYQAQYCWCEVNRIEVGAVQYMVVVREVPAGLDSDLMSLNINIVL